MDQFSLDLLTIYRHKYDSEWSISFLEFCELGEEGQALLRLGQKNGRLYFRAFWMKGGAE